ncbi:MAG TPA: hypothetical protein VIV40_20310, partial [Kofleriaceae bacterium]
KSRRGLIIGVVLLAALVPAVTIALAMMKQGGHATADGGALASGGDGAVAMAAGDAMTAGDASSTTTVAAATSDAATSDAAVAALRAVEIRVNVPTAKIEIDGAPVVADQGVARVSLGDGSHRVVVSAAGRGTIDKTIEVASGIGPVTLHLERTKQRPTQAATGSGSAAGKGSGSSAVSKDYTLDPFK